MHYKPKRFSRDVNIFEKYLADYTRMTVLSVTTSLNFFKNVLYNVFHWNNRDSEMPFFYTNICNCANVIIIEK